MKQSKLQMSLAVALGLVNAQAFALGLGQVEVRSRLSEPLVAEIPVIASAGEIDSLTVRLAPADAFARVGLDRPLSLVANLEFSVGSNKRGERVIRVTTTRPIDDPFLSFLIEAEWNGGKLVREFSVLLDPPYLAKTPNVAVQAPSAPSAPVQQPTVAQPLTPTPAPVAKPLPAPVPSAPVASATPMPAASAAASTQIVGGQFGPVRSGQTLSQIASELRPDGVGLNRTMAALLRANPEAFIDGNINLLKRGAILRIPGRAEIEAIDSAEAAALVHEQTLAWQRRREPQLQPVDNVAADNRTRQVRGSADPDARLRIVPPAGAGDAAATQSGASSSGGGAQLQAELDQTREQLATRDGEIKELRARITDLEKLNRDSDTLLQMKNSELAQLQQRLRELEAAQEAASAKPAPSAASAGDADAGAVPTSVAKTESGATATPEPGKPEVTKPAPAQPMPAKPVPAKAAPAPSTDAAPWYRMPIAIAGGSVLLVGLLAWLLARRGRRTPLQRQSRRGSSAGDLAASFESMRADGEDALATDAHRRELEAAVAAHPEQLEAHLALLRHLNAHGALDAFEAAAAEMRAHVVDTHGPQWQEAVAMGSLLLPDSPLFQDAADDFAEQAAAAVAEQAELAVAAEPQPEASDGDRIDEAFVRVLSEFADTPSKPASAWDEAEPVAPAIAESDAGQGEDVLEIVDAAPEPAFAESSDTETTSDAGADDPVSTKLDLAQAYIDIGDFEAAQALLEEVSAEGSAEQQQRAARLLGDLR